MSTDVKPIATPGRVDEAEAEPRPDVSNLTPVVLEKGVPVALPGTVLVATLLQSWYGERLFGEGHGPTSAAEVKVTAPDGRSEVVVFPFFRAKTVLGNRLYLDGNRESIYLFVVPQP